MTLIPRLLVRRRELDLAVDTARSQQGRVKDVDAVGGHDDLDVLSGLKAIELKSRLRNVFSLSTMLVSFSQAYLILS
jgi:hypothetical protein